MDVETIIINSDLKSIISPETDRTQHWTLPAWQQPELAYPRELLASQPGVVELSLLQVREGRHQGLCGDGAEVVVAQVEAAHYFSSS